MPPSHHADASTRSNVTPEDYLRWQRRCHLRSAVVCKACGLTLQEFHRWLRGVGRLPSEPHTRLDAVVRTLNELEQMGVHRPDVAVNARWFDGRSILDLIAENKLTKSRLEEAATEMWHREEARQRIKPRNSKTPLEPVELVWMLNQA